MENFFETLEHTADGAYIVDAQQRIVFWNKAAEELLGHKAREVLGRSCYQVFGGLDKLGCPICRRRCVPFVASGRGERLSDFDVQVQDKEGHAHWVNVSLITLPGANDTPQAVIHLFRNVDAQKQTEDFVRTVVDQVRRIDLEPTNPSGTRDPFPTHHRLTPREQQVLELLAQGEDTATIAKRLVISEVTVRNHVQHILHKLDVHSRLEAVAYAREQGLL